MRTVDIIVMGKTGAGKSTFFRSLSAVQDFENFEFINTDLYYYMYFQNDKESVSYNYKKAKEYCNYKIKKVVGNDKSFVWEDVFTKSEKLDLLRKCSRKNYKVIGYFIGIDNYTTLLKRVNSRSIAGWYDVPKEKVISRYNAIMNNFNLLCQLSTDFFAFDSFNSEYELVYAKCNNEIEYITNSCVWLTNCLTV